MTQEAPQRASFIAMAHGSAEDYELAMAVAQVESRERPDRILAMLKEMKESGGFRICRFEHSIQSATRAFRDGRDEEYVVCALLHDIGDALAPHSHSEVAALVLRPFISEANCWMLEHHGLFQTYYYAHHFGRDRHARDQFRDNPHYERTVEFCALYDQNSFDPDFDNLPLSHFEPMVRRLMNPDA